MSNTAGVIKFFHLHDGKEWDKNESEKESQQKRSLELQLRTSNVKESPLQKYLPKKPISPKGVECLDPKVVQMSPKLVSIVREASRCMESGRSPVLASEGLGGTYLLTNRNSRPIAVFKPCDEEPCAVNNPKNNNSSPDSVKRSVRAGEAAMRECAAYLLDHGHFAGVPETCFVKSAHPDYFDAEEVRLHKEKQMKEKVGSLQEYVDYDCSAEEVGPSAFSVSDVHRIAIFDIRVCNTDRHAGNLLVKWSTDDSGKKSARLIPIDHGFCLPESLEDVLFDWHYWPQARAPFTAEELAYIENLDVEKDISMLEKSFPLIRKGCLKTLRICTLFLKTAARAGLTLFDMANLMVRTGSSKPGEMEPSALETMSFAVQKKIDWKMAHVNHLLPAAKSRSLTDKFFWKALEKAFVEHFNSISPKKVDSAEIAAACVCASKTMLGGLSAHLEHKDECAMSPSALSSASTAESVDTLGHESDSNEPLHSGEKKDKALVQAAIFTLTTIPSSSNEAVQIWNSSLHTNIRQSLKLADASPP
eukprot:GILK01011189.1.p1 GENE.GILK01011189.1~~GILK01011189.1.p1  ORF type:complete len:532 (+),score=83.62 GILK01011189.1:301-1896(+)